MNLEKHLLSNNYISIDLEENSSGHFQFELKINSKSANFILDTGASNTCIAYSSVEKYNLIAAESELKAAGAGAINIDTFKAKVKMIEIGEIQLADREIIIFDLSDINQALEMENSPAIDGILGGDFLNESNAVISYKDKKLFIDNSI